MVCDGVEGRARHGKARQERAWCWVGQGRIEHGKAGQDRAVYGARRDRIGQNRVWQDVMWGRAGQSRVGKCECNAKHNVVLSALQGKANGIADSAQSEGQGRGDYK